MQVDTPILYFSETYLWLSFGQILKIKELSNAMKTS